MNPEFEPVFSRLREMLVPYSSRFSVTADTFDHYCLGIPFSPKAKKPFPVVWIKAVKGYVGYHFMPVYMFPDLRDGMSEKLRARMQGKSCFNFKVVDEALFEELKQVTNKGLAMLKEAGFE